MHPTQGFLHTRDNSATMWRKAATLEITGAINTVNVSDRSNPEERKAGGKPSRALELHLIYVSLTATHQTLPRL